MIAEVNSLGLHGISGFPVTVECHISSGLPGFDVVGLPDAAVQARPRERVRAAVKNSGFRFPVSRITLNLAPAGHEKDPARLYDLPILRRHPGGDRSLIPAAATSQVCLPRGS